MHWFDGRVAVVTGSAHGIGEAITRRLAGLGAEVIAVDRDGPALRRAYERDQAITAFVGDLASEDVRALAAEIVARFGPVELIVNNVGIDTPHSFLELNETELDLVLRTNLRGPWLFTRELVSDLVARDIGGAILFISSLHDHVVRRRPHYSASKAAVAMLVRELAYELAPKRIRVNAISPGVIESASVRPADPAEQASTRRLVPLGRVGAGAEVAAMAAVLLSEEYAGYVTGANVPVDGGLGLHTWSSER